MSLPAGFFDDSAAQQVVEEGAALSHQQQESSGSADTRPAPEFEDGGEDAKGAEKGSENATAADNDAAAWAELEKLAATVDGDVATVDNDAAAKAAKEFTTTISASHANQKDEEDDIVDDSKDTVVERSEEEIYVDRMIRVTQRVLNRRRKRGNDSHIAMSKSNAAVMDCILKIKQARVDKQKDLKDESPWD